MAEAIIPIPKASPVPHPNMDKETALKVASCAPVPAQVSDKSSLTSCRDPVAAARAVLLRSAPNKQVDKNLRIYPSLGFSFLSHTREFLSIFYCDFYAKILRSREE